MRPEPHIHTAASESAWPSGRRAPPEPLRDAPDRSPGRRWSACSPPDPARNLPDCHGADSPAWSRKREKYEAGALARRRSCPPISICGMNGCAMIRHTDRSKSASSNRASSSRSKLEHYTADFHDPFD